MATNTKINGQEYFRITKTIGYKVVDGEKKAVRKSFYGTSKRDAENKWFEWKGKQFSDSADPSRLTGDLAKEFDKFFQVSSKHAETTKGLYTSAYKKHFKALGIDSVPIGQLTSEHISNAYIDLQCSADALGTFNKWMKLFIKYCATRHYCSNIMNDVTIPAKEKVVKSEEIIVWEDDEIKTVRHAMVEHPYYPCIMLALYAGLRVSEVLGLKWSDIRDDTIHVNRQYYRGVFKPPKNNSNRIIPLHPEIKKALADYPRVSEYIFVTKSGRNIDYQNFETSMGRAYKRYNIPHKKFHAYRATFCTNLCRAGVPLETASKLMGHKDIRVTAEYYAKVKQDSMVEAIMKL